MTSGSPDLRRWSAQDRQILRLAGPALGALVAEPLYLLADSAVVGRLGTAPLAGLGLAATVLQTVVGLCIFLAYGTTAVVARQLGAGNRRGALRAGVDVVWLAMLLVLAATGILRGLRDTRTPFVVSAVSAAGNAVLSAVLVLGLGLGIAGSAATRSWPRTTSSSWCGRCSPSCWTPSPSRRRR